MMNDEERRQIEVIVRRMVENAYRAGYTLGFEHGEEKEQLQRSQDEAQKRFGSETQEGEMRLFTQEYSRLVQAEQRQADHLRAVAEREGGIIVPDTKVVVPGTKGAK
jgi:hypothetical protein